MFLLYLFGCRTSIQFNFLSVLVVFVFKFVVVLLLVVQGDTVCLPMPPCWPELPQLYFLPNFQVILMDSRLKSLAAMDKEQSEAGEDS